MILQVFLPLHALNMSSVSKSFGSTRALDNVSLKVEAGCVYGLLGPNGSGKSTLMRMVLDLVKPDSGEIQVYGMDVKQQPIEIKRIIGYVPETTRLYEFLTANEYLDFTGDIRSLDAKTKRQRVVEFLGALELEGRENEMMSGYSQGMKQKVAIIAALLHKPKLLILDEPLNGLDPRAARIVKDLIHKLAGEGVAAVFSTHVLEIAEAICDRIAIMYKGQVLSEGTAVELREQAGMPGSSLEDVFFKLTGTADIKEIVKELAK